jgi:hypothetical protein
MGRSRCARGSRRPHRSDVLPMTLIGSRSREPLRGVSAHCHDGNSPLQLCLQPTIAGPCVKPMTHQLALGLACDAVEPPVVLCEGVQDYLSGPPQGHELGVRRNV